MNKNVFGIILFSLIVGTAVFVSESFVTLPAPPQVDESPVYVSGRHCRKIVSRPSANSAASIKLVQAALNPKTNQLFTSIKVERQNPSTDNIGLTYHFYSKVGAETRYLASETVSIQPNFMGENIATHEITSSYSWLDNLDTKNNIYMIAESSNNGFSRSQSIPRFDQALATPILLMK